MKENRLDELKQAYESIPIPEGLEFRVRSSIAQAKQDLKKEPRNDMKSHKIMPKLWKNTVITAAAAMLTIVVLANSGAGIARAMEQVPVLGAITRVVTFRTYDNTQGNMSAHVDVPQVEGGSEELNQRIKDYTETIIQQYQADVKASGGKGTMDVALSYRTVTDNDSLFALRFDKTIIMASGDQSVKIYNVDKATGKIITLDKLFKSGSSYVAPISENIKEQMRQQVKKDPNLAYWVDDTDVPGVNFQSIDQDATFYVNQEGKLVIVFDEGEAGPACMGVVEFTIPNSVTSNIALPGYLK